MTTPKHWQQLTCVDFIEWLDHTFRTRVVEGVLRGDARLGELQVADAWNRFLINLYHGNATGERFDAIDHVASWCFAWVGRDVWFLISNERQARGLMDGRERTTTKLISELEAEQLQQLIDTTSPEAHRAPQMAPAGEGWLTALLGDLTERQRQAVALTIVGDWTPSQAAEHLGCKPTHVRSAKHHAIEGMRRRIESGRVRVPGRTAVA